MAKEKTKESKAGRAPVWEPGTTPNKADTKKHVKAFNEQEGRKSKAALAKYCAEQGISAEGIAAMSSDTVGKEIDVENAATLRRAAMRDLNGGAKVKRKAKAEEAETKEKAKGSKKGGKKSK